MRADSSRTSPNAASLRRLLLYVLLPSLLSARGARGNGAHGVFFLFPKGGELFYYLDTANVTYQSPFPAPLLYAFCQQDGSPVQRYVDHVDAYNSSQLVQMDFTGGNQCWFDLRPNSSAGYGDNSGTWTLASSQRPLSPAVVGLTQTAALPTSSASASAAQPAHDGLSGGATAGIAVASALGAILLGAAALAVWYRRKKSRGSLAPEKKGGDYKYHPTPDTGTDAYAAHDGLMASTPGSYGYGQGPGLPLVEMPTRESHQASWKHPQELPAKEPVSHELEVPRAR